MPYLSGFHYRKAIKISTAGIPASTLTAFPKLFTITADTDIGAKLSSQKMAVTLADGTTQVPYGAISFSSGGGAATIKIRAKFSLSSSLANGDTIGYIYYDATATDQSDKANVFASDCKLYLPLEENPAGASPQMLDWTSNANNGISAGTWSSGDSVTAQVGNGLSFDGVDRRISLDAMTAITGGEYTFLWNASIVAGGVDNFLFDTANSGRLVLTLNGGNFSGNHNAISLFDGATRNYGAANSIASPTNINHFAVTLSAAGNVGIGYVNGASTGTDSYSTANIGNPAKLGSRNNGAAAFYKGILDEFRIYTGIKSADWIAYDYTDQFANSTTFTLGAEETDIPASGGGRGIGDLFGNIFGNVFGDLEPPITGY